jgi:acetolactate synthase-1/2/3 large subunit
MGEKPEGIDGATGLVLRLPMSRTFHKGSDCLVAALAAHGVRKIFALSGNHVMPVFDATIGTGIEIVHVRHEAATVHMADAYARITGEVGVALVTGGPGHANALGALYTAAMAESPVLLLSGHAPLAELGQGAFQEMRQAELAAPLTKASRLVARPQAIAADVARAMHEARSGQPGPVHLSLPTDVLEASVEQVPSPVPASQRGLMNMSHVAARLANAARPLILCGPALMTRRGRARMAALEASCAIPVVGMESPRGVNDPALGAFAGVLGRADYVALAGKRRDFTLRFGKVFAPDCEVVSIDAGNAADATFESLVRDVGRHAGAGWHEEVRAAIAYRPPEWDALRTVRALRSLQPLLDSHPDAVFVCDGGEFGQWAQACLTAQHRVINGIAGSIGAGLPFAAGARSAVPDAPILAFMGDGTFGFHPAEIDTAVRHRLPFVAIVGNDARWNAEYQIQLRTYGPERLVGCELLPTRYDEVAKAFGGYGEHVDDPAQLASAVRRAMASGLPAVIDLAIEGLAAPVVRGA